MDLNECIEDARTAILESAEYARDFLDGMSDSRIEEWLDEEAWNEAIDGSVPIYNHDIFDVLRDPRVWSQDVSDYGEPRDMAQGAQFAIYMAIEEELNNDREGLIAAIRERIEVA